MPNVFITHKQFVEGMIESARLVVGVMPLAKVIDLEAALSKTTHVSGTGGALMVSMLIAARDRLKEANAESPIIP